MNWQPWETNRGHCYYRLHLWGSQLFILYVLILYMCLSVYQSLCVTIMRDDSPGGEGGVQASKHPEHAEPAQMFSTFIHLQELSEVGVHNWNGATNSGGGIIKHKISVILHRCFWFWCDFVQILGHPIPLDVRQICFIDNLSHICILNEKLCKAIP